MNYTISLIVGMGDNRVIGRDGDLPWHLPNDLKNFKKVTMGCPVIMGRKTYESIVERLGKPLPGRTNIVLTRNKDYECESEICSSFTEAFVAAKQESSDEIFIIGGEGVYKSALQEGVVDKLYITNIDCTVEGDVYFPEVDLKDWDLVLEQPHSKDERHEFDYCFREYKKTIDD
jgi:dihydrofolate reductase